MPSQEANRGQDNAGQRHGAHRAAPDSLDYAPKADCDITRLIIHSSSAPQTCRIYAARNMAVRSWHRFGLDQATTPIYK
jgi:hypothetical protein